MKPNRRAPGRLAACAAATVVALAAVMTTVACDPVSKTWAWMPGKTHGALIETTAGRASLAIYRVPSRALFLVYKGNGSSIRAVQDAMWAVGKPPKLRKRFSYRGRSITLEFGTATKALAALTRKLIYDRPNDLRGALIAAHDHNSCLALTLISYGRPTSNWTQKQAGCRNGSLR